MGKKRGCKGAHPARKYPRREALYRRRLACPGGVVEICQGSGVHYVDYMKLEQVRPDAGRAQEPKSRYLWKGWKAIAERLANFYLCEPEELFPEEARCAERTRRRAESLKGVASSLVSDYTKQSALPSDERYEQEELKRAVRSSMKRCNSTERTILKVMFGMIPLLEPPSFRYAGVLCGITDFGAEIVYDYALYKMSVLPELDMLAAFVPEGAKKRLLYLRRQFRLNARGEMHGKRKRIWKRVY